MKTNKSTVPVAISRRIDGRKWQVEFKDFWLLYNFGTYHGHFWTRKSAIEEAQKMVDDDWRKYFQVVKGNLKITLPPTPNQ